MTDNESNINYLLQSNTIKIRLGSKRRRVTDIKEACNEFLSYVKKHNLNSKQLKLNGYLFCDDDVVGVFGIDGKLWSVEQDVIWED